MVGTKRSTSSELYTVARAKKRDGPGTVVRIDSDLVAKCRYLAARAGKDMSVYISNLLRPVVDKEFRKAGRELFGDEPEGRE
jgi:hypothetical protein